MSEAHPLSRLLRANPFFSGLGEDVLQAVARLCVTRSLGAQEVLFQKNDPADALYAVRRGEIRIGTGTQEGRQLTLNLLGPGDVFGEVALLDGHPRTADAVATEPTDLFVIRRRDLLDLLAQQPRIAVALIELLCRRVRWMSERMEETTFLPVPARLARRLTALAEDYGDDIAVSQEELAEFANTTRETVNRQLQAWRHEALVELGRRRIRLRDRAALAMIAGHDRAKG
ncbi:transcriptional regulator, Crp/Fnr family [Methylobacterium sp. 4-46]|uniref:Crp/Fnr family transcriptional regulator n=1 Tax=unclassified Methylobacterium TaxID=2615210 RepID=UPI000152C23E|nr:MULTISPECIES: Crp/Fnr family transcriptional regulator [Methylobacterium]ACA15282.1 transcriptional regulator, Crp/Fnr family [Methylobacterium sp. 4-46]WFT81010.1 Crp/Fnr family transcriptional regulator [Methylobacterium nodulans]